MGMVNLPALPPIVSCSPPFYSKTMYCCARVQYEPEIFPGLIYRMKVPKVVLLIFVSGKVVLTGTGKVIEEK